ncbi:MAG TPA: class I SAM-dependent methyltransferase [Terracidiphilus sp.]|nr:class I SAM-dependent methyltransferase [Terracidiphilus sp.]
MATAQEHYSNLLAKHYTWMFGTTFEEKAAEQRAILTELLGPRAEAGSTLAVDLGCGPGFQSIALAQMGYSPVLAIDTSRSLLDELESHRHALGGNLPIQTLCDDVMDIGGLVSPSTARVIVSMGDTITHLASRAAIAALIQSVATALVPGGRFIVTFRDLSAELAGLDRFIPVYGDDDRVMTCFLEFDRPDSVLVHDLVYCRDGAKWNLAKSSYRKLRVAEEWLASAMTSAGLAVESGRAGRLIRITGTKPGS